MTSTASWQMDCYAFADILPQCASNDSAESHSNPRIRRCCDSCMPSRIHSACQGKRMEAIGNMHRSVRASRGSRGIGANQANIGSFSKTWLQVITGLECIQTNTAKILQALIRLRRQVWMLRALPGPGEGLDACLQSKAAGGLQGQKRAHVEMHAKK